VDDPPEGQPDAIIYSTETRIPQNDTWVFELNVLSNDTNPDQAALNITRVGRARFGRAEIAAGNKIKFTIDTTFGQGTDTFTYTVGTVGTNYTSVDAVTIAINPGGDVVANSDQYTALEDKPLTFNVLDNDTNADPNTSIRLLGVIPGSGSVSAQPNGLIAYQPAPNIFGTDVFTYVVGNGALGADMGVVTITIDAVNDPPTAVADVISTTQGISTTIDVLNNDFDLDGDVVGVAEIINGRGGSVQINGDGTLTYTPEPEFRGTDVFGYILRDAHGRDDIGVVAVTVIGRNRTPAAVRDLVSLPEDSSHEFNVLSNDFDEDNDPLTIVSFTTAEHGQVRHLLNGNLVYTPTTNFFGQDAFTYTISDGNLTASTPVNIQVNPVPDAPVATHDTPKSALNTARQIFVLANDYDPDGDLLTITQLGASTKGTVELQNDHGTQILLYTPDADASGQDIFSYTISDGRLNTTGFVTVTLGVTNTAPQAVRDEVTTPEDTSLTIPVLDNDWDADGDALLVVAHAQPPKGLVAITHGELTYQPVANFVGTETFTYTLSDGAHQSVGTVSVTTLPIEDGPTAVEDTRYTTKNETITFSVLENDYDVDLERVNVTAVGQAQHGTVTLQSNYPLPVSDRKITFTPETNFVGTTTFTYTLSDGRFHSEGLVTIIISEEPVVDVGEKQIASEGVTVYPAASFLATGGQAEIRWDFGDGYLVKNTLTPSHTFADEGQYLVTLTITDTEGDVGVDVVIYTIENAVPNVDAGQDLFLTGNYLTTFAGSFVDPGWLDTHTIAWDFGDGITATGTLSPSHQYATFGTYTVTLTITDNDGGVGEDTMIVVAGFQYHFPIVFVDDSQ
jgi:hypothetical protein